MNRIRRINTDALSYGSNTGVYVNGNGSNCCAKKFDCDGMALAASYVKSQEFENLYGQEEALRHGTLFRDLDKPFMQGGRSVR
ncbi:MAG: spore coat associated protein CotJA [Ruminococcaceae bacterium]|nr:spore coat associated protein CotJA [Oscillospiraceae bacterium]